MLLRSLSLLLCLSLLSTIAAQAEPDGGAAAPASTTRLQKRWLFIWGNMNDPKEVDRVIGRLPRAAADGYNGLALSGSVAPPKVNELTAAAKKNGLDIIAIVMGGPKDRNYTEGVLCSNALFVVHDRRATLEQDNPTRVLNGDFEDVTGNHFKSWSFQDDEGVTTFADHDVVHGGKVSLR